MEDLNAFKNELQHIIIGDDQKWADNLIKAAQVHIKPGPYAGTKAETKRFTRSEEERALSEFTNAKNLWVDEPRLEIYLAEGAEQKVYFADNSTYSVSANFQ